MKRFKSILFVTQADADQHMALQRAVTLATNNQANLTVLDVIPEHPPGTGLPPGTPLDSEMMGHELAQHRQYMDTLIAPFREHRDIAVEIRDGKRSVEAIRAVLRNGHDLVIKVCEHESWLQRLFGSDDMRLLRACPCPLWLMKPDSQPNYGCILSAVDFDPLDLQDSINSALNTAILDLSASIALSDFAQWQIIHAWEAPAEGMLRSWTRQPEESAQQYIEAERQRHQHGIDLLCAETRLRFGDDSWQHLSPHIHLPRGNPAQVIPALAAQLEADLVVMGTLARSGLAGMLIGNTAEHILSQLHCSVLAVKPPGFISPITLQA